MKTLALLGAAGLGAWWLSKRQSPALGVSPRPDEAPVQPRAIDVKAITADVPYERFGDPLLLGANDGSQMAYGWKECFLDVGSRIPLSSITQKDMALAFRLMGGDMDRFGEAFTPRTKLIREAEAQIAAGKAVTDLFATVLSFIPVYGQLLKVGLSYASKDMEAGIAQLEGKIKAGQKVKVTLDVEQATDTTLMVLGNPTTDCKYLSPRAGRPVNCNVGFNQSGAAGTASVDYAIQRQGMLKEYIGGATDVDIFGPDESIPHCRLFTQTRSGYVLPWLAAELGASTAASNLISDERSKVYGIPVTSVRQSSIIWSEAVFKRAMCFRIFDLVISQFWPPVHDSLQGPKRWVSYSSWSPYAGRRYSYHNPFFGDLWESVFPPTHGEDTYIIKDGVKLDYYGNPVDDTLRVKAASSTTLGIDPRTQAAANLGSLGGLYNPESTSGGAGATESFDVPGGYVPPPGQAAPAAAPQMGAPTLMGGPEGGIVLSQVSTLYGGDLAFAASPTDVSPLATAPTTTQPATSAPAAPVATSTVSPQSRTSLSTVRSRYAIYG